MNSVDPVHGSLPINYRPQPKKIWQENEGGHHHPSHHDDSVELSNVSDAQEIEETPDESLAHFDAFGEEVHQLDIAV